MSAARWDRLVQDLAAAGVNAKVTSKAYCEDRRGRVHNGVSRSIVIRIDACVVEIGDRWWSKNPDIWVGWEVSLIDAADIVIARERWTKTRSDVVASVDRLVTQIHAEVGR